MGDSRRIGEILVAFGVLTQAQIEAALAQDTAEEDRLDKAETSVRVDVTLLDHLMNLVGELVLARNQLLQLIGQRSDAELMVPAQRLNIITTELQEGVMKTRMQPIGKVFQRFPRVVRDLASQCGKQVRIRMEGAETELDRGVLEAIKDPLTHLVRNAIDHGIEKPTVRTRRGKSAEGTLTLRAYHEGGKVNIEIIDDGGGIDAEIIRQKIVERGLASADTAASMPTREVLQHIFAPGFSTAAKVTNISGRGVGMDVVKTNIERIGGTVELGTHVGVGTTFKIKIPLTLAIVPALVVLSGGYRYVLPQISLVELLRLDGDEAARASSCCTAHRCTACEASCCRSSTSTTCSATVTAGSAWWTTQSADSWPVRRSTWSCSRPTTSSSVWSSTASSTPRRSWSSRSASS